MGVSVRAFGGGLYITHYIAKLKQNMHSATIIRSPLILNCGSRAWDVRTDLPNFHPVEVEEGINPPEHDKLPVRPLNFRSGTNKKRPASKRYGPISRRRDIESLSALKKKARGAKKEEELFQGAMRPLFIFLEHDLC